MKFLSNLLKGAPRLKSWLGVAITVLQYVEAVVENINSDKNLPTIK